MHISFRRYVSSMIHKNETLSNSMANSFVFAHSCPIKRIHGPSLIIDGKIRSENATRVPGDGLPSFDLRSSRNSYTNHSFSGSHLGSSRFNSNNALAILKAT